MEKVLMKGNEALAEAAIMAGCTHSSSNLDRGIFRA